MKPRPATILFLLAVAAGLLFAAVSTYDFVQHLDRQLHGIHCSFIPGLGALDSTGSSGCATALMSPYSSVFRGTIWGGIPVALAGMAVFAFLLYRGVDLLLAGQQTHQRATQHLVLFSLVPVLTSIVMGAIAIFELGELCKLCVGIYAASFVALGAAVWAWTNARAAARMAAITGDEIEDGEWPPRSPGRHLVVAAAQATIFVALPLAAYMVVVPDASAYIGSCGSLVKADDPYGVLLSLDDNEGGIPMIEVLDPLCPACRGFEARFDASGKSGLVHRRGLLFPLDDSCNWMVSSALHPGACDISAAVLCADDRAVEVIDWAFENQVTIREAAATDATAARDMVTARFPELAKCVGSSKARSRLNRSMRWAVANQLPVMMPQVFIDGVKLCDEDTDLGLDFALERMLDPAGVVAGGQEATP